MHYCLVSVKIFAAISSLLWNFTDMHAFNISFIFYIFNSLGKFNLPFRSFWMHIANNDIIYVLHNIWRSRLYPMLFWEINLIIWFVFGPPKKKLIWHFIKDLVLCCNNVIHNIIYIHGLIERLPKIISNLKDKKFKLFLLFHVLYWTLFDPVWWSLWSFW